MVTAIGAFSGLLGVWLYAWDHNSGAAPLFLVVGLACLGIGGYFSI